MKKTLAILGFSALVGSAFAQSFTENFDVLTGAVAGASGTITGQQTWQFVNASTGGPGTTSWFQGNTTVFNAQAGPASGYIGANFNNSTGSNAINNFLMSQVRTFNNGDTISFWTRTVGTVTFPDRLILKLSKSGASTNVADFNTTLLTVNPTLTTTGYPSAWTQFTATVSGLSGPTSGRFAFNYNVTNAGPSGANSDYIGIDTAAYTAVPEPGTMAALGLGAAALLRRRRKNSK
jgi:hypothetical protein